MIKYYYTCPVQAAYMAKEFGVGFINPLEFHLFMNNISDFFDKVEYIIKTMNRIYVAINSYHHFEVREGDIIKENNASKSEWIVTLPQRKFNDYKIISRQLGDRCHSYFFHPLTENTTEEND